MKDNCSLPAISKLGTDSCIERIILISIRCEAWPNVSSMASVNVSMHSGIWVALSPYLFSSSL